MKKIVLCVLSIFLLGLYSFSQDDAQYDDLLGQDRVNTITTAVPFLMIAPDARGGSMGDAGVASTPDANSMHWNPAKYAFIESDMGFSMSYSPWLRKLVNDINLAFVTGYYRLDERQTIAASLRYFSLGYITFTDDRGNDIGNYKPSEFVFSGAYTLKLSDNFSGGIAAKYINSNLTQGQQIGQATTSAGQSVAADVSAYYNKALNLSGQKSKIAAGLNISNIGNKISYTEIEDDKDFIPTNLGIGAAFTTELDEYNEITAMVDFNKLLVPTPAIYYPDSTRNGEPVILEGEEADDKSVVGGMFSSFGDAPKGFSEEMHEITYSFGFEYWYDKQFALRAGYFTEHKTKGNRKYFTLGAGLKYNVFGLDFAYLIPTEQQNPLENTLRFSLLFDFAAFQNQN